MTVQPVSFLSIFGMALTLILSIGVPVALFIRIRKAMEVKTSSLVFGAIIYYVAAKIFEPFINAAILSNIGGAMMNNVFIYAIYVAIIAAVTEEALRYLALKSIVRNVDENNALYFGLGFCGLEALLIAAWPQVSNILNSLLINNGLMAQSLATLQEPDLSSTYFAIAPLWETSSLAFMLAGFERVLIMAMHICLSLLVFYYIKDGNKRNFYLAFAAHFAVVFCSALLSQLGSPMFSVLTTAAVTAGLVIVMRCLHAEYEAKNADYVVGISENTAEANGEE